MTTAKYTSSICRLFSQRGRFAPGVAGYLGRIDEHPFYPINDNNYALWNIAGNTHLFTLRRGRYTNRIDTPNCARKGYGGASSSVRLSDALLHGGQVFCLRLKCITLIHHIASVGVCRGPHEHNGPGAAADYKAANALLCQCTRATRRQFSNVVCLTTSVLRQHGNRCRL